MGGQTLRESRRRKKYGGTDGVETAMEELVERPKNAVPAEDNVDVHIQLDIQTVYDLFKVGNFLNLIKENAGRLSGGQPLFQIGVQFL